MTSPASQAPSIRVKQAVALLGVRDMQRSLRFYVDGLGFRQTLQWIDDGVLRWCWLELDDVAVMLQEYRPGFLPPEKLGVGVTMNFICDDAVALWRLFAARGLEPSRPFVGNGMWVTNLVDPDGYALSFESPTDAPEESVLADQ